MIKPTLIFPVHTKSARQTAQHLVLHLMATGHTNTIQEAMEKGVVTLIKQ